jgi:hypothetical protein
VDFRVAGRKLIGANGAEIDFREALHPSLYELDLCHLGTEVSAAQGRLVLHMFSACWRPSGARI